MNVQVIEKAQKKAQFFAGKGKHFIMKLFFEEFNLVFFTAESAWPVLKCNEGSDVLENFEIVFYSMVEEITLLKGNLCIFKCFIDV